jgi:hypothetical protein
MIVNYGSDSQRLYPGQGKGLDFHRYADGSQTHPWTFYICRPYFVIPSEPERSGGDGRSRDHGCP